MRGAIHSLVEPLPGQRGPGRGQLIPRHDHERAGLVVASCLSGSLGSSGQSVGELRLGKPAMHLSFLRDAAGVTRAAYAAAAVEHVGHGRAQCGSASRAHSRQAFQPPAVCGVFQRLQRVNAQLVGTRVRRQHRGWFEAAPEVRCCREAAPAIASNLCSATRLALASAVLFSAAVLADVPMPRVHTDRCSLALRPLKAL